MKNVVRSTNPGTEAHEGMIGQKTPVERPDCQHYESKQMTNVRSATKDQIAGYQDLVILTWCLNLEFFEMDDEATEVTPESIRLRKQRTKQNEKQRQRKISSC